MLKSARISKLGACHLYCVRRSYDVANAAMALPAKNKIVIRNRYLLLGALVGICGGLGYFMLSGG
jgi:hypothetical protein